NVDEVAPAAWKPFGGDGEIGTTALTSPIENFYMTDPISRASVTMAQCSDLLPGEDKDKTGTDG
ncbi:MAG: hypothetical protein V1262_05090, partial [Alphaproteobacteria bacterium]|nr:hypothetical protein [Alphaproteobacteria bacterium]